MATTQAANPNHETSPPGADGAAVRLPGMLVIGAMKASTTAFYELLTRRPGVWMPGVKEPHYFTSKGYGQPGALRDYAALFDPAPQGALLGEASTGYTKAPHLGPTPQRIRETLGAPRMIYLVRDPVDRIVSNYRHSIQAGHYDSGLSLARATEADPILVSASRYAQQTRAYHDEFGPEPLLILTTDELHTDPRGVMRRVEEFLGLDPWDGWPDSMPSRNSQGDLARSLAAQRVAPAGLRNAARRWLPAGVRGAAKRLLPTGKKPVGRVTDDEVRLLQRLIEPDLAEFSRLLGDRVAHWPSVVRMNAGGAPS